MQMLCLRYVFMHKRAPPFIRSSSGFSVAFTSLLDLNYKCNLNYLLDNLIHSSNIANSPVFTLHGVTGTKWLRNIFAGARQRYKLGPSVLYVFLKRIIHWLLRPHVFSIACSFFPWGFSGLEIRYMYRITLVNLYVSAHSTGMSLQLAQIFLCCLEICISTLQGSVLFFSKMVLVVRWYAHSHVEFEWPKIFSLDVFWMHKYKSWLKL